MPMSPEMLIGCVDGWLDPLMLNLVMSARK